MPRARKRTAAASASQWVRPASLPLGARGARQPVAQRAPKIQTLAQTNAGVEMPVYLARLMHGEGPQLLQPGQTNGPVPRPSNWDTPLPVLMQVGLISCSGSIPSKIPPSRVSEASGVPPVKGTSMSASLRITPTDPFPEDLEKLKDEKLQVLDSQVHRQLDQEIVTAGEPHPETEFRHQELGYGVRAPRQLERPSSWNRDNPGGTLPKWLRL